MSSDCECLAREECYEAPKEECPKYEISVQPFDRGYLVKIGCKCFAFSSKEELIQYVVGYLDNPNYMIKRFLEGKMKFDGSDADFINTGE